MKQEQNPLENLGEICDEKDALDQSIALNRIVMTMLQHQKESNKRMFIVLIISLIINVCIVAGFLYYESLWEYETTTTTITQEVEADCNSYHNSPHTATDIPESEYLYEA